MDYQANALRDNSKMKNTNKIRQWTFIGKPKTKFPKLLFQKSRTTQNSSKVYAPIIRKTIQSTKESFYKSNR